MKKRHTSTVSDRELDAIEDRTRTDAAEGPSLGRDFWNEARVVYPAEPKRQLTVRLDADMVEWFKAQGRGYQPRMNAVLRSYYEAHRRGT